MPTYLIAIGEMEMFGVSDGAEAAEAVEQYYAELDAYCSPSEEISDEATVSALLLPDEVAAQAGELLADLDEDAADTIEAMVAARGPVRWRTLDVVFERGEWKVTERT